MTILLLPLALALASAQQNGAAPAPKRPRDPWVFRCVLDKRPRMVTVALSDDLWIAYDTTYCGMYKAWKGGVNFDGPVYTTVHGPQPTTLGRTYEEGIEGDVWLAEIAGKESPAMAQWRGYRFNGDHVALLYDVVLEDGRKVSVQESPEFVRPEEMFDDAHLEEYVLTRGHPGLFRSFLARDIPDGVKVSLELRTDGVTGKLGESLEHERFEDFEDGKGEKHTRIFSHVALTKERPLSNLVLFFAPVPDAPKETK